MTTKTGKQTATKSTRAEKDALAKQDKQAESTNYAKVNLSASCMSAVLSDAYSEKLFPKIDLTDAIDCLKDKIKGITDGDMQPIEAMLIGQAQALQTMFVYLGKQAVQKSSLQQYTAFMNMALKAQAQSRATIQALTELKYPKQATFVKQANIANGNQQVNNGSLPTSTHAPAHAPARAIENQPNELLEAQHNEWLDNGKTTTPSATNQTMATVAT
jgi:putative sterol carrier protein